MAKQLFSRPYLNNQEQQQIIFKRGSYRHCVFVIRAGYDPVKRNFEDMFTLPKQRERRKPSKGNYVFCAYVLIAFQSKIQEKQKYILHCM